MPFNETVDAPLQNVELTSNVKVEKFLPIVKLSVCAFAPKSEAKENDESMIKTYLDRQCRNEYVNFASQISYDRKNIAFVFYENQILNL